DIRHGDAGNHRLSVAPDCHAQHAAEGLNRQVMSRASTVRTRLTKSAERAVDNAWIARTEHLVPDTEALDDSRTKGLHEHIGGVTQIQQALALRGILQIQ